MTISRTFTDRAFAANGRIWLTECGHRYRVTSVLASGRIGQEVVCACGQVSTLVTTFAAPLPNRDLTREDRMAQAVLF